MLTKYVITDVILHSSVYLYVGLGHSASIADNRSVCPAHFPYPSPSVTKGLWVIHFHFRLTIHPLTYSVCVCVFTFTFILNSSRLR